MMQIFPWKEGLFFVSEMIRKLGQNDTEKNGYLHDDGIYSVTHKNIQALLMSKYS